MAGSKVCLKNPVLAGVLAFLMPGMGHLYQGRTFKGLLYLVCILGTFAFGMRLGNGKVVYFDWEPEKRTWPYLCQFWTGLPALPALAQAWLRAPSSFEPNRLPSKLVAPFEGTFGTNDEELGIVSGLIELDRMDGDTGFGQRQGQIKSATLITKNGEFPLSGTIDDFSIDPQVAPDRKREVSGTFEGQAEGRNPALIKTHFVGYVERSVWDRFEAPLQDRKFLFNAATDLDRAHFQLGTRFELGVVYTMIAGLLNILAIYDALEGPAYEEEEQKEPAPDAGTPPEG